MVDEEDEEETVRTVKKQSEMLFVRGTAIVVWLFRESECADGRIGDSVVLISPQQ